MKRILSLLAMALACATLAAASTSSSHTTVQNIRSLSRAQVLEHRPVTFEATVTYYRPQVRDLFVQDGEAGIYLQTSAPQQLNPGDRVRVSGTTDWGYVANVAASQITVIGHRQLPKPAPATFEQLIRGQLDSRSVVVKGVVQAADLHQPIGSEKPIAVLRIQIDGSDIWAEVQHPDHTSLQHLLDSQVEITGVAGGKFDGKMELTGISLRINSPDDIKILKPAAVDPWSVPSTQMNDILQFYRPSNNTGRVRVSGVVTYFEPGSAAVLQDGARSLWIRTETQIPIRIGDLAEATGFPSVNNGYLVLSGAEIKDTGVPAPIAPRLLKWKDLASSKYIFDLVSIDAKVLMAARENHQDEYVLLADGQMFSAIFPHPSGSTDLPPVGSIPVGSTVRVTGICAMDNANPFGHDVPFNIFLRSAGDVRMIAPPSFLTVDNLLQLVFVLLLAVLAVVARASWAGRTMRQKVAELGYLSLRRGEVLEQINRSRPLAETLECITELASMTLKGAPCWFRIAEGPCIGNCPADPNASSLRVMEVPIASHSGVPLGSIYAAFDARAKKRNDQTKSLTAAAELATLAIETSRLHTDLVHRSEFDMLTEIQNRFAFEKRLDELIAEMQISGGMFALIYIDLNDFKLVNDRYGHQAGDLYLQMVTERMKHQLRPRDTLARLGGDEFGVLVPVIYTRNDAEDIVRRLERCFEEPFAVKSYIVRGSASIGVAIYPSDGATNDEIMSVADTAMYERKRSKPVPRPVAAVDVQLKVVG